MAQQPIAERGDQHRVGDLLRFHRGQELLFVEPFVDENRRSQIKRRHHGAATGVEVKGQCSRARILAVPNRLDDGVVQRANDIGFVIDEAGLGKASGTRSDHDKKWIFALYVDRRIVGGRLSGSPPRMDDSSHRHPASRW